MDEYDDYIDFKYVMDEYTEEDCYLSFIDHMNALQAMTLDDVHFLTRHENTMKEEIMRKLSKEILETIDWSSATIPYYDEDSLEVDTDEWIQTKIDENYKIHVRQVDFKDKVERLMEHIFPKIKINYEWERLKEGTDYTKSVNFLGWNLDSMLRYEQREDEKGNIQREIKMSDVKSKEMILQEIIVRIAAIGFVGTTEIEVRNNPLRDIQDKIKTRSDVQILRVMNRIIHNDTVTQSTIDNVVKMQYEEVDEELLFMLVVLLIDMIQYGSRHVHILEYGLASAKIPLGTEGDDRVYVSHTQFVEYMTRMLSDVFWVIPEWRIHQCWTNTYEREGMKLTAYHDIPLGMYIQIRDKVEAYGTVIKNEYKAKILNALIQKHIYRPRVYGRKDFKMRGYRTRITERRGVGEEDPIDEENYSSDTERTNILKRNKEQGITNRAYNTFRRIIRREESRNSERI